MKKQCPCCGKEFECRHDDILSCQCTQIYLSSDVLAYIDKLYPGWAIFKTKRDIESSHRRWNYTSQSSPIVKPTKAAILNIRKITKLNNRRM
ncbi:MAG: cysteine-rich CWC family protein [Prevotella sp.]|jgi:hypothetical protein|nr:cysteine-rich CWC family protein [Prevotella sp.]